ncbi:MAG: pantoate kinase [Archaeoglobaceae archaeon]
MIFCPAAISCIFSPKIEDKPENSGSIGVGFTIDKGVLAKHSRGLKFNGKDIELPTVSYVLKRAGLEGVEIFSDLPLGCGFGLSGASAIATAFLAEKPNVELFDLAHEAEVVNLTGLGTVATIAYSGLVIRKTACCPSRIVVERYAWNYELDFLSVGSISTKDVLSKRKDIAEIGKKCLKEFMREISLRNLFKCSKAFAEETGLIEPVRDIIEAVESSGGVASMAMLGKTVFAKNGFSALKEFGKPFRARIDCCGVRKVDSLCNSVQNWRHEEC